ncbi:MAG: hypothetical protein QXY49_02635 [Thermofilaceae archaeon]
MRIILSISPARYDPVAVFNPLPAVGLCGVSGSSRGVDLGGG